VSAERRVEKLRPDHKIEGFDCGREELNRYLQRYAWQNQQAGAAQTYVGLVGDSVIGHHTLAVGQVSREQAPARLTKGLARHPVPVMLLARLAVDRCWHGQGVGKALLKDAMQRTLQAAHIAGIRAFAVHAKDEEARTFYQKFDFVRSPTRSHTFVRAAERRTAYHRGTVSGGSDLLDVRSFAIKDHRNAPRAQDCGPGFGEIDHYKLLTPVLGTASTCRWRRVRIRQRW
jgi:GNAT superfamily N-acetyltransferase